VLVTYLLDVDACPANEPLELYRQHWGIEAEVA
jgi:hypothetical protein